MRKVTAEQDDTGPIGAVGVDGAARYFSISRRKFYDLLDEHQDLDQASFYIGTRRLWRIATLEDWAKRQEGRSQTKREAA